MKLGLNIGCGKVDRRQSTPEVLWINIDADPAVNPDLVASVSDLDTRFMGQADEIVANDILEHIPYAQNNHTEHQIVLNSWVRCLKPGGVIRVQVPDPDAIIALYQNGSLDETAMLRVIYGENTGRWDRHYQMITLRRLKSSMMMAGVEIIESSILNICAIVFGRKPA